jgi:choline dehydrogenase
VNRFDVIVVGGGSAGCALAARLSEDASRSVLLIEAGPVPRALGEYPADLLDAGSVRGADPGHPDNWAFDATLAAGRPYSIARGRILGGSSTINGGYFIRPRKSDFDRWSADGNAEWSFDANLPFLRALESDAQYGSTDTHGGAGPVVVSRPRQDHPVSVAFAAAAERLGFAVETDKNAQAPPGVGAVPMDVAAGIRWNSGLAYIEPILDRENLTVLGDTLVLRVLFEGPRAVGVETAGGDFEAGEVVLCAGSVKSPHLLMLSGVGPRVALERFGVPVVSDLPGVGSGFSDHPQVSVEWRQKVDTVDFDGETTMASALNFSSEGSPVPGDLEILPMLKPMAYLTSGQRVAGPLAFLVSVQNGRSRGAITLSSADPRVQPTIDYRYLSFDLDRRMMREAVRTAESLLVSTPFASLFGGFVSLPVAASDAELDRWIDDNLGTSIHLCGSARFGARGDADAVVDQYGRVFGVSGLRVADTSILPTAPVRGPAVAAILVGERVASFIRSAPLR